MSLGLAAGLHGAALAYALTWTGRVTVEAKVEDVVTVEIVDAAMLEEEAAPEPPVDKVPSAAAKASDAAPEDASPERMQTAEAQIAPPVEIASAAPELGEAQRETVTEEPLPVEPEPVAAEPVSAADTADTADAPKPTAHEPEDTPVAGEALPPALRQSADPSPVLPDQSATIDTPPPAAEPRLAMAAPPEHFPTRWIPVGRRQVLEANNPDRHSDSQGSENGLVEAPAVAVTPPAATSQSPPETRPDELAQSAVAYRMRKSIRPLKTAALAARPLDEATVEALKPKPKVAEALKPKAKPTPKRVAKLEPAPEKPKKTPPKKAEPPAAKAEKAAKKQPAKGKRLAALAVEGEGTASGGAKPARAKAKLKGNGKSGAKSGKGVSGATTSGANALAAYASVVRTRVNRNSPSAGLVRGTRVDFALTTSGGLRYVRVTRSSGSSAADQAAMAAVKRSAPFPTPPQGATGNQLIYNITFKSK